MLQILSSINHLLLTMLHSLELMLQKTIFYLFLIDYEGFLVDDAAVKNPVLVKRQG